MKENGHRARARHRAEILARLRPGRPASRGELVRETGLSAATVSRITRELVRGRVLREIPPAAPAVGRPLRGLEINAEAGAVAGVSFLYPAVRVVVLTLRGDPLAQSETPFDPRRGPDRLLAVLRSALRGLLRRPETRGGRLRGVGLALPGQWDRAAGISRTYPRVPGWHDVPLRRLLERWTGAPATLIGYAPALAVAEQARGPRPEPRNLLCVEVAENVALGVLANGEALEGASGNAGELGHVVVDPGGPRCYCGHRGCLETVATTIAAVELARRELPRPRPADYEALVRRATAGDPAAARLLARVGRALGAGLAVALNLLNPERLVLHGRFFAAGDIVLDPLRDGIRDNALASTWRSLAIERSSLGPAAAAHGAGLAAIRDALLRLTDGSRRPRP